MQCVMDAIPARAVEPGGVAPTQTEFLHSNPDSFPSLPFFRSTSTRMENFESGENGGMLVLRNKAPRWHEQLQCWCLNFNGRVTVASVKNFQLVASPENGVAAGQEHENVILQFGKVGKDVFTMDYQYPISAFQAFAICLSSFDTKIACEWLASAKQVAIHSRNAWNSSSLYLNQNLFPFFFLSFSEVLFVFWRCAKSYFA